MVTPRRQFGDNGESIASEYLTSHGFLIIERNYQKKEGEIDIIATKEGEYFFIEVKTRSSSFFGEVFETISEEKYERLYEVLDLFLKDQGMSSEETPFHISGIYILWNKKKSPEIHFVEDLGDMYI